MREWWREAIGAILVLAARIGSMPKTPWENDEFLFMEAVRHFDPANYHPHPPGFPLYVLAGKAVNAFAHDPFHSLVFIGIAASVGTFVALCFLFRVLTDDADVAVAGALLVSFSPSMIVHAPLALSDSAAVFCAGFALLAMTLLARDATERAAIAAAFWTSAAIGCRPQLLVPLLPVFALALVRMTRAQRVPSIAMFSLTSTMWFVPLVIAAGGIREVMAYEGKQASYFATHDAAMSRGARSTSEILTRFLIHPWGPKSLTLPLIILAVAGTVTLGWRIRRGSPLRPWIPIVLFTAVQVVFELGFMDPADAARYALPSTILFGLLVASGLGLLRSILPVRTTPLTAAAFLAAMSWWYVEPLISERVERDSPPAAAAAFIARNYPPNSVVLYDFAMRPHVEYLLPQYRSRFLESGSGSLYDRPEVAAVILADGGSHHRDAKVFSWPESDAYGKLTRNLYRVVTVDPLRPEERFLAESGVYSLERNIAGDEWRWLQRRAVIRLPDRHATAVNLTFALSHDAPYESDPVAISVNGTRGGSVTVSRQAAASVTVALPAGPPLELEIDAARDFFPATVLRNQDPRSLAVQLIGLEQTGPSTPPSAAKP